jgi:hypothetical protein
VAGAEGSDRDTRGRSFSGRWYVDPAPSAWKTGCSLAAASVAADMLGASAARLRAPPLPARAATIRTAAGRNQCGIGIGR